VIVWKMRSEQVSRRSPAPVDILCVFVVQPEPPTAIALPVLNRAVRLKAPVKTELLCVFNGMQVLFHRQSSVNIR
jgi:hypothetical protein